MPWTELKPKPRCPRASDAPRILTKVLGPLYSLADGGQLGELIRRKLNIQRTEIIL